MRLFDKKFEMFSRKNKCLFLGCLLRKKLNKQYVYDLKEILDVFIFPDELCCGLPLRNLGYKEDYEKQKIKVKEFIENHNIGEIICICPSCYQSLKIIKQDLNLDVNLKYSLEVLKPLTKISGNWYIHIPCHAVEFYELFESISKNLFENYTILEEYKYAMCCGGGSNLPMNYPEVSESLAKYIISQAHGKNIATECPMCYYQLKKYYENVYLISELITNQYKKLMEN